MELSKIASVSGKGGLFHILGPTRSGLILESLDEHKSKLITPANQKVSVLDEISIYTTSEEGTVPLGKVLKSISETFDGALTVDPEGGPAVLAGFMKKVLPDYDEQRVYQSDIKKLIKWYTILKNFAPEVLTSAQESKD